MIKRNNKAVVGATLKTEKLNSLIGKADIPYTYASSNINFVPIEGGSFRLLGVTFATKINIKKDHRYFMLAHFKENFEITNQMLLGLWSNDTTPIARANHIINGTDYYAIVDGIDKDYNNAIPVFQIITSVSSTKTLEYAIVIDLTDIDLYYLSANQFYERYSQYFKQASSGVETQCYKRVSSIGKRETLQTSISSLFGIQNIPTETISSANRYFRCYATNNRFDYSSGIYNSVDYKSGAISNSDYLLLIIKTNISSSNFGDVYFTQGTAVNYRELSIYKVGNYVLSKQRLSTSSNESQSYHFRISQPSLVNYKLESAVLINLTATGLSNLTPQQFYETFKDNIDTLANGDSINEKLKFAFKNDKQSSTLILANTTLPNAKKGFAHINKRIGINTIKNQLLDMNLGIYPANASNVVIDGSTYTLTLNSNYSSYMQLYRNQTLLGNRKYLAIVKLQANGNKVVALRVGGNTSTFLYNVTNQMQTFSTMLETTLNNSVFGLYLSSNNGWSVGDSLIVKDFMLIDLSLMFGRNNNIPQNVETMFDEYIPYNVGTLSYGGDINVSGNDLTYTNGKPRTLLYGVNGFGGDELTSTPITKLFSQVRLGELSWSYYSSSKVFYADISDIAKAYNVGERPTIYCKFYKALKSGGASSNTDDMSIWKENGSASNTIYLKDLRFTNATELGNYLNNIKLLYANNNTERLSTLKRKYGIVDLGTLEWNYNSTQGYFYADASALGHKQYSSGDYGTPIVCEKYAQDSGYNIYNGLVDKAICLGAIYTANYNIVLRDTSITNPVILKAVLSGKYLVYELANETTTNASGFSPLLFVDSNANIKCENPTCVEIEYNI